MMMMNMIDNANENEDYTNADDDNRRKSMMCVDVWSETDLELGEVGQWRRPLLDSDAFRRHHRKSRDDLRRRGARPKVKATSSDTWSTPHHIDTRHWEA